MYVVRTSEQLHEAIAVRRAALASPEHDHHHQAERVALVPTMGALHGGHLSLVNVARQRGATCVVATIFVNRAQFGPDEDFEQYPRSLERDQELLASVGTDVLYLPTEEEIYPHGLTTDQGGGGPIELPSWTRILCGHFRPAFFPGIARVVLRMLELCRPHMLILGRKDRQQWRMIEWLVARYGLPIEVIGAPTVREEDGLAMSSRNAYLSREAPKTTSSSSASAAASQSTSAKEHQHHHGGQLLSERARAATLYHVLRETAARIATATEGTGAVWPSSREAAIQRLTDAGLQVQYLELLRADSFQTPVGVSREHLVLYAAAHLGNVRLIDNLEVIAR